MKYFYTALALLFILFFALLPQTTYAALTNVESYSPDKCGNWTQSTQCGLPISTTTGAVGSCNYTEKHYLCPSTSTSSDPIDCFQRTPLSCGNGVTVCSHGDGYTCDKWCSDLHTPICQQLRDATNNTEQPGVVKTSNCKGCGHPGYPACPGSVVNTLPPDPSDTRVDCSQYYTDCLNTSIAACKDPNNPNRQCSNTGQDGNVCPGQYTQCNPSHQCVYQPPDSVYPQCTLGQTSGLVYSCQNGPSCPSGTSPRYYTSGKVCPAGQTCCYNSNIKYKCSGNLCVGDGGDGTGTFTENTCGGTCEPVSTPTSPPAPAPGGSCTITDVHVTGPNSASATVRVTDFDRVDWKLNGRIMSTGDVVVVSNGNNIHTFSNLVPGTDYKVTAVGWADPNGSYKNNQSKPCIGDIPIPPRKKPDTPPPDTLKCTVCNNRSCWYTDGTTEYQSYCGCSGTGDFPTPNLNLPGTPNHKPGQGCYRPSKPVEPPQYGTLGGKIWVVDSCTDVGSLVNRTANLTQVDQGNVLYWVYSTNSNGDPMCQDNNGYYCQLRSDNPSGYLSGANQILGTISGTDGGPLFSGNSVSLVSWDSTKFKPIGYYRYQHEVGEDCHQGDNGVECNKHSCQPLAAPEFFYWGGWLCDGCSGAPGIFRGDLVNGSYPNPDAPYCMVGVQSAALGEVLGNARIDWVFARAGAGAAANTVSGYAYAGNNVGVANATVNLSDVGSAQTDASGHYSFTSVPDGNYNLSISPPAGFAIGDTQLDSTPIQIKSSGTGCGGANGSASVTQNFQLKQAYSISGRVQNDLNLDGVCDDSEPTFAGTVTLKGFTQKQPISLSGDGRYIFDNLAISPGNASATYQVTVDPGTGATYQKIMSIPPSQTADFCIKVPRPWIRTKNGDVFSNTQINLPKGVNP